MKLNHYVIGSISITLGILFNSFLRLLTQPLSTAPFLPLGVNTIVYNNREYNAELLYTNARGEGWLVCVAGVYKAEIVNDEIKIVKKLKPRLQSECP
jgi:hypothetical protein